MRHFHPPSPIRPIFIIFKILCISLAVLGLSAARVIFLVVHVGSSSLTRD